VQQQYIASLQKLIHDFAETTGLYPAARANAAGEYLFHQLVAGWPASFTREADQLATDFDRVVALAQSSVERNRPADADKALRFLPLIIDSLGNF
jgi:hypothetical protein